MSHRYLRFFLWALFLLCVTAIAFLVTYIFAQPPLSAHAPSEDTPIDQIVSCVYPMSGQYGLLPRLLFYASLIFASTMRSSGWFANIVLGLAMSYSTTAFVHIIVIYATHGWHPPILDLDVLGIFLLGAVGVSMYPAIAVSRVARRSSYMKFGVQVVIGYWWLIMFLLSSLATILLNNHKNLRQNSNSEVACYLPDSTLLTSLAQLNGTRDLECIYDCFLTRKSVIKTQDAVTVVLGSPMNDNMGRWGLSIGNIMSNLMLLLGSDIHTYTRILDRLRVLVLGPFYSVANHDKRPIMTPIVYICLISMAPWVIMIEYSLRDIPVEEMSFAVGQWAPWVAALFAVIGAAIYRSLQDPKTVANSPTGYMMSGALLEPSDNVPMGYMLALDRSEDTAASDDEIDIGTYRITPEQER
ncbi:hypothetical protein ACLOAV_002173 [Pseudogymnoascus australis]